MLYPISAKWLADSGNAYLVRVHNSTANEVSASLQFPTIKLAEAYIGSSMGERLAPVAWTLNTVTLPMKKYDIKTIVVRVQSH